MALEIERKYLVTSVPANDAWPVPYKDIQIIQTYLVPRKVDARISSERVRFSSSVDGDFSTHTQKIFVSDGVHEETEKVISERGHRRLCQRRDKTKSTIFKTRRVFVYKNQTFELDFFHYYYRGDYNGDFSRERAVYLEIELSSMDTPVILPPWLGIDREVTFEKGHSNAALAAAWHNNEWHPEEFLRT